MSGGKRPLFFVKGIFVCVQQERTLSGISARIIFDFGAVVLRIQRFGEN